MDRHDDIVSGLADRTRNLLRALDRQDRLETAAEFVGWLGDRDDADLSAAAREMLLRALRLAGDPINYEMLRRLDPLNATEVPALMAATGLGRVAVSERIHDLVQAGLASRELHYDQVRSTALAVGLIAWTEEIARLCGSRLLEELRTNAPKESR